MPAGINIANILVSIGANVKQFERQMKRVGDRMKQVGDKLTTAGTKLTVGLTAPLAGVAGAALKMSADFDKSMAKSTAIMGDLEDSMRENLEATARDVAKETTFSAKQMADSYFFLASAGLDATQSIAALPQVTQFATAGAFDLATATDLLTDAQSALGLTVSDAAENLTNMTRVSDVLVKANTLANASVQQFSEALTNRAGAALRLVGKELEEGIATLAVYADQGVKGAEAGTRLDIALRELRIAASKNEDEFKSMGITVFDTAGNMVNIADIVRDLERRFEGLSDKQKTTTLTTLGFTAKSQQALLMLIGFSDKLRQYEQQLRDAGGITQQVADKQLQNLSDQFAILLGQVADVAIELGKALTPTFLDLFKILKNGLSVVENFVKAFAELPKAMRTTVVVLGLLAAAIGPVLLGLGLLAKASSVAAAGVAALSGALGFLVANPLVSLAVGVGIAGVAILGYIDHAKKAEDATEDLGEAIDETAKRMKRVEGLGGLEEQVAKIDRFQQRLANLTREFQDATIEGPTIRPTFDIPELDMAPIEKQLEALEKGFPFRIAGLEEAPKRVQERAREIGVVLLKLRAQAKQMAEELGVPFEKLTPAFVEHEKQLDQLEQAYADQFKAIAAANSKYEASRKVQQAVAEEIENVQKQIRNQVEALSQIKTPDAFANATADIEELREHLASLQEQQDSFATDNVADELTNVQERLAATQRLITDLSQLSIDEAFEGLIEAQADIDALKERLAELLGTQKEVKIESEELPAIMQDWSKQMAAVGIEARVLGADYDELGQKIGLTEQAIGALIDKQLEQALTSSEVDAAIARIIVDMDREGTAINNLIGHLRELQLARQQSAPQEELIGAIDAANAAYMRLGVTMGGLQQNNQDLQTAINASREALMQMEQQGILPMMGSYLAMSAQLQGLEEDLLRNQNAWVVWAENMRNVTSSTQGVLNEFGQISFNAFQSFADGLGRAIAQIAVFGEDSKEVFANLWKQIAAQFISSLISMAVQLVVFTILSALLGGKLFAAQITKAAGRSAAAGFSSVMEALPWPANIIVAPIVAGAAGAATIAVATGFAAGGGGLAEGGIVNKPTMALIGEAGPEAVIPLDDRMAVARAFKPALTEIMQEDLLKGLPALGKGAMVDGPTIALLGEAGREVVMPLPDNSSPLANMSIKDGNVVVELYMDSRDFARVVTSRMPGVVRRKIGSAMQ